MRSNNISIKVIIFMFLGAFLLMLPTLAHAGPFAMNNYCVVPPYVKTNIDPNIMLMLDNSFINRSWAYGDEVDKSSGAGAEFGTGAFNFYEGWRAIAADARFEGLFKPDIRYSFISGGSMFVPDNGGTMDPNSDGEAGVFDGNMLAWATTSRLDLTMAVLIDGSGVPTVDVATLRSENGAFRKSDGTEQIVWPVKRYRYKDASDAVNDCLITVNEGSRGLLTIRPNGGSICGLILDTRVGPRSSHSYATASAEIPEASPVMYAGALEPLASEDIIDREKLKAISEQAEEYLNIMLDAISPKQAYAAPPVAELEIVTPKRSNGNQAYDWSGGEHVSLKPPEDVISWEFDIGYTNSVAFTYLLEGTNGEPYDISARGPYDWSIYKAYPANVKHSYSFTDVQNPVSGNYETFLSTTLDYSDGNVVGSLGEFWVTVHAEDTLGEDEYALLHFINTVAAPGSEETFKIQICAGDYDTNCDKTTPDYEKTGLLQEYWPRAQFGYTDFSSKVTNPSVSYCIEESLSDRDKMPNAFGNQAQNASAMGDFETFTYLVDGFHETILSYMGENSAPLCDPFEDDEITCRNNFVLMLTSAEGADLVTDASTYTPGGSGRVFDVSGISACSTVVSDLAKNACYAANTDLRSAGVGALPVIEGTQKVSTFIVDAMSANAANSDILREAAIYGGGEYYAVENPRDLREKLQEAFQDILSRAASGTAASVLASGEGSGANLMQAVYYPRRRFLDPETNEYTTLKWFGRMANFWYYIDPFFSNSNIREEVSSGESSPTLNLIADPIIEMAFDPVAESVVAYRWNDTDGDGDPDTPTPTDPVKPFERVGYIWEAGLKLWKTDPSERTLYMPDVISTPRPGKTKDLIQITNTTAFYQNANVKAAYGVVTGWGSGLANWESMSITRFILGYEDPNCWLLDASPCRSRKLKLDVNDDGVLESNVEPFPGYSETFDETTAKVWKLGDVLNSTPRIAATVANHKYDIAYEDTTYADYVAGSDYQGRGLAFAGGNDGMLHAFRLGKLEHNWDGSSTLEHARLSGTDLGKEEWAFIPADALPYLRYQLLDSYCHIYTVDQSPYLLDLSPIDNGTGLVDATAKRDVNSWRTIVIGGMRFGGACVNAGGSCTKDTNGDGIKDGKDCVKTPVSNYGYSSYFALDITDPTVPPKLLWEFTHSGLGYSTTGPTIVHIAPINSDDPDNIYPDGDANGYWYTVIGSGPTGPIDTDVNQFLGTSDQEMKFFVFDTYDGPDSGTTEISTGIDNAYASSMFNISFDTRLGQEGYQDYTDDAMYVGFVQECTDTRLTEPGCTKGQWNDGGVGRIITYSDPNPENWEFSILVNNIGPVTAAPTKAISFVDDIIYVLVSTGRYYYVRPEDPLDADSPSMPDDHATVRRIAAYIDPCYKDDKTGYDPAGCKTTQVDVSKMIDVTTEVDAAIGVQEGGWFIIMDAEDAALNYGSERVITDLVVTEDGLLFVTSFKPYTDECSVGGKSHLWAMLLDSGSSAGALLKGTAVMQVSTGSIEKIDLGEAFTEKDGRRSEMIEGKPPISQGLALIKPPPPVDRILHFIERDY